MSDTKTAEPRARINRQPLRIPKMAELVASQIRNTIIRGELKEGDTLSPEAIQVDEFGVSRPTIREALRILESEELISVSRGSRGGARVVGLKHEPVARSAGFFLQSRNTTLADVYEARKIIEPAAAAIAAERAHDTAPAALRQRIEEAVAVGEDPELAAGAISNFHQTLLECAGNQTLLLLANVLQDIVRKHQAVVGLERVRKGEDRLTTYKLGMRSFRRLANLIEAQRAKEAETHWRAHMENADKVWLQGLGPTSVLELID